MRTENDWMDEAPCATPKPVGDGNEERLIDFYSRDPEEMARAKALCSDCPVRRMCAQYALDNKERYGIFAGADEIKLRQIQSINAKGEAHNYKRSKIKCLYCPARNENKLEVLERKRTRTHLRCTVCGLNWWVRKYINLTLTNF